MVKYDLTDFNKEFVEQLEAQCVQETEIDTMIKAIDKKKYVIQRDFCSVEALDREFEELYGYLKIGFTIDRFRTHTIPFRFTPKGKVHEMQLRRFVSNLILWRTVLSLGGSIEEEHLVDFDVTTRGMLNNYYNRHFIQAFRDSVSMKELNAAMADTTDALAQIPLDFNILMGMTVTTETYMGTAKQFPRFEEILRYQLDPNAQAHEVEEIVHDLTKEQVHIIKQDPHSLIRVMLEAGEGVRESALQEFIVAGSNKPDLEGNTMPVPIDRNFIMGGLTNIINYYIDAVAGRKSIILNKTEMGKSGYFAFLVTLLCSNVFLNQEKDDCGTINFLHAEIKTQKHLNMYIGRYYVAEKGKLKQITEEDTHLIGTTIKLRSPITCACKKGVCRTCYGKLFDLNKDISIGALSAILIMLKVQQDILSSKHILATSTTPVVFTDLFYNYFKLFSNEIMLNSENLPDIPNVDKFHLIIDEEDIEKSDSLSSSISGAMTTKFYIGTVKKKRGKDEYEIDKIHAFHEENHAELTIVDDVEDMSEKERERAQFKHHQGIYHKALTDIPEDMTIFSMEFENNELTKPLYDIKNILNKEDHNGLFTYDEVANGLLDCVITAKIPVRAVNSELLVYPLIRSKQDKFSRPNFKKHVFDEDIRVMSVLTALKNNPSITIKLSSESLEEQFKDIDTYKVRESSYLDDFFRDRLMPIMDDAIRGIEYEAMDDDEWDEDAI